MKEPLIGNYFMEYDMKDGSFSLWMSSYVKVKCQMTYDMYPFDTQTCKFEMKSVTSNLTYQVRCQKDILLYSMLPTM